MVCGEDDGECVLRVALGCWLMVEGYGGFGLEEGRRTSCPVCEEMSVGVQRVLRRDLGRFTVEGGGVVDWRYLDRSLAREVFWGFVVGFRRALSLWLLGEVW